MDITRGTDAPRRRGSTRKDLHAESTAVTELSERRSSNDDGTLSRIIAAGKRGDPIAIGKLYDRFSADVLGYVRSIVRDEHDAEDITQNVFIKLMRVLPQYEPRSVPFAAWLLRVARNVAFDHLRAQRSIPCEEIRDPTHESADNGVELDFLLRDALAGLSHEQRRVVLWRHLVGLSPVEIAEHLGRTEGSIHALHHRGRRAVQAQLRSVGAAPSTMVARRPALALAS